MDTSKLKPFDLQRALAGDPVVTRDGRKVHQLAHFATVPENYRLVVLIEGQTSQTFMFEDGRNYRDTQAHNDDLFMAPKTREVWGNVYDSETTHGLATHHSSEEIVNMAHANFGDMVRNRMGNCAHKITIIE